MADADFDPSSITDWGMLSPERRSAELLRQHMLLARRHAELVDGQNAINSHLDVSIRANAQATEALTKRLDDNTRLTVENTALAQSIKNDTAEIVDIFKKGKTTVTVIDWVAKFVAKVAVPGGLIYGGWKAFQAWLGR
jgi:hypothetical protein